MHEAADAQPSRNQGDTKWKENADTYKASTTFSSTFVKSFS